MENVLVSIIVPVYNAESYLKECIDSIIKQTYGNIEIILVDDGSTDCSGEICNDYAKEDERITVFHQNNGGAASARKKGILAAKGEYICFVDADDKIATDMVEYFVEHIDGCDLMTLGCDYEDPKHKVHTLYDSFAPGIYRTDEEVNYIVRNMLIFENRFEDGFLPFLWTKMFTTSICIDVVNGIDERITFAEDRDFLFRYILKCKAIVVVKESFYFYRYVPTSIMHRVNKRFMHDLNALYLSLESEFSKHPQRDSLLNQLQIYIASRVYRITEYMGFAYTAQTIKYVFPLLNHLSGKRVVLYGAGKVGISYYRQFYNDKDISVILWVDKNWSKYDEMDMPVSPIEEMQDVEYDCIVVAVLHEELQREIRNDLQAAGVPEEKIWWEKPISTEK